MNKAVFFDRDGVINEERGEYTWRLEDFRINEGLIEFMQWCQDNGYILIVISNQGGIGKGIYTHNDVEKVHAYFVNELKRNGVLLLDIYYCPHHPNTGRCLCRKPETIMLEKAIARFDVDTSKSIFIGDSKRDIEAGEKVGLRTFLVKPNSNLWFLKQEIFDRLTKG